MTLKPMIPSYRGFKGTIVNDPASDYTYIARGLIEQVDATTLKIKELPIGKWMVDYEAFLELISQPNYKGKGPIIEAYTNLGNDIDIQKGLVEKFRLTRRISIKNMHLHDRNGIIKKYDNPEQILKEFYGARLTYYDIRLAKKKTKLELENEILDNKIRFITLIGKKEIDISGKRPEIQSLMTASELFSGIRRKFCWVHVFFMLIRRVNRNFSTKPFCLATLRFSSDNST
ncbi:hypothetical protein M0R45_023204 [Rubus argutus]|uniref:DNA topoisomerase (ATP-hydrolyzing) n=1 Tax=Rubus argutus TaxID=59490 RepID=A0AAW1WQM6_RUBAR